VRCEHDRDWTGTEIPWPNAAATATHWRDLLGGGIVQRRGESVGVEVVLGNLPVAVLVPFRDDGDRAM